MHTVGSTCITGAYLVDNHQSPHADDDEQRCASGSTAGERASVQKPEAGATKNFVFLTKFLRLVINYR